MTVHSREHFCRVARHVCKEARTKITGWVQSEATVEAVRQADDEDKHAHTEWHHTVRWAKVFLIRDGHDAQHEHKGTECL